MVQTFAETSQLIATFVAGEWFIFCYCMPYSGGLKSCLNYCEPYSGNNGRSKLLVEGSIYVIVIYTEVIYSEVIGLA